MFLSISRAVVRVVGCLGIPLAIANNCAQERKTQLDAAQAGSFAVTTWSHDQGLPANWVECLTQTRDGYLWMGTRAGLARFDGVQFTLFPSGDPNKIRTDNCKDLVEDRDGNLWIATKKALLRLRHGQFTSYTSKDGLCGDETTSLFISRSGGVWIGTSGGVSRFLNGGFINYPATRDPFIYALFEDRQGELWVGRTTGLSQLDQTSGEFHEIWSAPVPGVRNEFNIFRCIAEDSEGRIWFGTQGGLYCLDSGHVQKFGKERGLDDDYIQTILQTEDHTIWILTAHELYRFEGERFVPAGLKSKLGAAMRSCIKDQEGNIWLGTEYDGLVRVRRSPITTLREDQGLCNNEVTSIASGETGIWIGTLAGLSCWKDGHFIPVSFPENISKLRLRSVFESRMEHVCFCDAYQIYDFSKKGSTFEPCVAPALASAETSVIYEDKATNLWIGGKNGLTRCIPNPKWRSARLDQGKVYPYSETWLYQEGGVSCLVVAGFVVPGRFLNGFWHWQVDAERRLAEDNPAIRINLGASTTNLVAGKLSDFDVRSILQDRNGRWWFGTAKGGLNSIEQGKFTAVNSRDGLASDFVCALHEDADGVLWAGGDNGLTRLKAGHLAAITPQHGLVDKQVNQILEDTFGYFWIGCNSGIYRVSRSDLNEVADGRKPKLTCLLFDSSDGMLISGTSGAFQPSGCKTPDGKFWFPTHKGVVIIDPANIKSKNSNPRVHIESAITNTKEYSLDSPAGTMVLPPGSGTHLEFHYTAIDLAAPTKLHFRYRLRGSETTWQNAGTVRLVRYANLPPGQYLFEVTACNRHGTWNETPSTLAFSISPYYWQTWWFQSAVVLVAGGSIWRFFSWRLATNRRIQTFERQEALGSERRRIARDLHDHIGSQLTRLVVTNTLARTCSNRPRAAKNSRDSADLAQKALLSLHEVIWLTDPSKDTLQHTWDYLCRYAREFFAGTAVQIRFDPSEIIPTVTLLADRRQALIRAVQECFTNILKHARANQAVLSLRAVGPTLVLAVEDDGIGFLPASAYDSNGLSNISERMREVGGHAQIDSAPGHGAAVKLFIPIS